MQEKIKCTYIPGLVSVIIPTYRRPLKLKRAIGSVLWQTYPHLEVLVVNDNENDDAYTAEVKQVVSSIHDERLLLLFQEKHINGAAARNVGIRAAKGEYIAFLDDDDYWDKDKLLIQIGILIGLDHSYGGVSCLNRIFVDGKLRHAQIAYRDGAICRRILMRRCEISTITLLLRHTALDETGYFDESLKRHQEVQLLSMLTTKYKLKLIKKYLSNVDSTTNENQPDPLQMEAVKKQFIDSVKPAIRAMRKSDQKKVCIMNRFDIGLIMLKRGMYREGLKRFCAVFRYPSTVYFAIEHIFRKLARSLLCNMLVRDGKEYIAS